MEKENKLKEGGGLNMDKPTFYGMFFVVQKDMKPQIKYRYPEATDENIIEIAVRCVETGEVREFTSLGFLEKLGFNVK